MTCTDVAGLLRMAYSIPESVKIEQPSEDEKPKEKHRYHDLVAKYEKIKAARRERYRKSKQIPDQ